MEPIDGKLEFPAGYGAQDYYIGPAIHAETLDALPYAERAPAVVAAIESLGPSPADERPAPPDLRLQRAVDHRRAATGVGEVEAMFVEVLRALCDDAASTEAGPSAQTRAILDAVLKGRDLPQSMATPALTALVHGLRGA